MESGRETSRRVADGATGPGRLLGSAMIWGRVWLGMVLVGTGAAALGQAWIREGVWLWFVGGIAVLIGAALVLSGCRSSVGLRQGSTDVVASPDFPER